MCQEKNMSIDANEFKRDLATAFVKLLESKRGTASKLAKAVGKPSSFINEVKRGKPVNSIHLKAVGLVFGPEKVLELLSLKNVNSDFVADQDTAHSADISPIFIEHQKIIGRFKDPELGKTLNEQLVVIQDDSGIFKGIVSSIKSAFDTVMAMKRARSGYSNDESKKIS